MFNLHANIFATKDIYSQTLIMDKYLNRIEHIDSQHITNSYRYCKVGMDGMNHR